jgi:hypothetical protein
VASSQATTEFDVHISPAPSSSRPQTGRGTVPIAARIRRAASRSDETRRGPPTASARSGIVPPRRQRTS